MLLLVTGGTGSGKTAYAGRLAESLGREAILLSCPSWPPLGADSGGGGESAANEGPAERVRRFAWTRLPADEDCASALHRINLDSNPYRAERRVLVLDSLSGWLRHRVLEASRAGDEAGTAEATETLVAALLAFEGIVIVVSEEAAAGWAADRWERFYIRLLAQANRRLADASHTIYRLTFGIAAAIRGERN